MSKKANLTEDEIVCWAWFVYFGAGLIISKALDFFNSPMGPLAIILIAMAVFFIFVIFICFYLYENIWKE